MSCSSKPRAIIVPGNGCPPGKVHKSNWYGWMQDELVKTGIFSDVVLRDMPDPFGAKECEWVPFLLRDCAVDANTLIIAHSSGAEAAMRLMEKNPVLVTLPRFQHCHIPP
jgi:predicted alpha/beta hydrolase family esterase